LLEESIQWLAPERGGLFVDCTVGLGGHAEALLERFGDVELVGLDRDPRALELAGERLRRFGRRVRLAAARFDQLGERLAELGVERIDGGVLADLGVSSMQLDEAARGFAFAREGPLDMRMGEGELTAHEILNRYSEDQLTKILRDYGEERHARRIAREIVAERERGALDTTADLRRVVERAKPAAPGFRGRSKPGRSRSRGGRKPRRHARSAGIHPATQTFQALRIEVNRELDQLRDLIDGSVRMLADDGNLVIISYHSLEDRIVKHRFRELATGEIEPITGRPRAETQVIEVLTKKPVRPTATEVESNPRARSARLRAARRL
jgi:16S rRNA (cytosine1402-N4)-methyltransferase